MIATHLEPKDILKFTLTNKSLSDMVSDEFFWKLKVEKDYGKHKSSIKWIELFNPIFIGEENLVRVWGLF